MAPTAHVLGALTYAYRITDDNCYLKIAARQFAALTEAPAGGGGGKKYVDASGAVIKGQGGGRIFAELNKSNIHLIYLSLPRSFIVY